MWNKICVFTSYTQILLLPSQPSERPKQRRWPQGSKNPEATCLGFLPRSRGLFPPLHKVIVLMCGRAGPYLGGAVWYRGKNPGTGAGTTRFAPLPSHILDSVFCRHSCSTELSCLICKMVTRGLNNSNKVVGVLRS